METLQRLDKYVNRLDEVRYAGAVTHPTIQTAINYFPTERLRQQLSIIN
jgi:hypothetical protein